MKNKLLLLGLSVMSLNAWAQSGKMDSKITSEETIKVCKDIKKKYRYFSENAPVTMADGATQEIASVRVGDYVRTFKKGISVITLVEQIDVYNFPTAWLTAVYLRPAMETTASAIIHEPVPALLFEATPHHEVLTSEGRKKIKQLRKKDTLFHYEPATGELTAWKVGAIQENARKVTKAYNLKTSDGSYLVENVMVY